MNDRYSTTEIISEKLTDSRILIWSKIDWKKVETGVKALQTRIAKATKEQKWNLVKRLTYLLTHSFYAKLLAVRKVTTNKGKRTPGVDGELWNTDESKEEAVFRLTDKRYNAKPLRRVLIEKKGKTTKRPLGIPCMIDRAMQALYALALSPIAETTADSHSFGFREGRCAQDACTYIFILLSNKKAPEWILEGDIKGCFDHISHDWLIENVPMDKSVLKQFLKAGYVFEEKLFATNEGTPQGGIISPILANMALDGIQELLDTHFKRRKVHLTRYADDFIVSADTKETAEKAKELIKNYLAGRGLELSEEKTLITHIDEGFDFLGWNFRKYNGTMLIKPSKKSIDSIVEKLSKAINEKGLALTQDELIKLLNPALRGWANYHKGTCAKRIFSLVYHRLFELLYAWAKHRHHNKSKEWIVKKYWHAKDGRNWVFSGESEELFNLAAVKIWRNPFMKLDMNPYLDTNYFESRKGNKSQAKTII